MSSSSSFGRLVHERRGPSCRRRARRTSSSPARARAPRSVSTPWQPLPKMQLQCDVQERDVDVPDVLLALRVLERDPLARRAARRPAVPSAVRSASCVSGHERIVAATVGSIGGSPLPTRSSPTSKRGLGPGRARAEPLELALYGRDAGTERGRAVAVCFPRSTEEVAAAVRIAARHDRSFVARGSGTGLAGGATPVDDPLVIVTTQMNRVLEVDVEARVAWVEPGVLNLDLSRAVAPPRPALRARPVVAAGLHDRRQRGHERRRAALPRRRRHRPRTCSRSTSCSPTARSPGSAGSSPTSPGFDLRGLLRRQRGHDGHRHPHRGAAPARPAVRAHAAARLHVDRRRRGDGERDHRRRDRARRRSR